MVTRPTRRQLLTLTGMGIASLTGCTDLQGNNDPDTNNPNNTPDNNQNTNDDDSNTTPPDQEPAYLHAKDRSKTKYPYPFTDLKEYGGRLSFYSEGDVPPHKDSRRIQIEVTPDALTVSVESMKLIRDLTLRVHYETNDGINTLSKTVSPESEEFQPYEWTFEESFRNVPELTTNHVFATLEDTHPGATTERGLKHHRYIIIPYENTNGPGTRYINHDSLNQNNYDSDGGYVESPARMHVEHLDTDTDRTTFLTISTSGNGNRRDYREHLLGTSTTITHSLHNTWNTEQSQSNWADHHPASYAYNAEDVPFLNNLAERFATSLDNERITDPFMRLQMLGHLVGNTPYAANNGTIPHPQFATLYLAEGNCQELSEYYIAIANTPAFQHTRCALIPCYLEGLGQHAVIGIDERDLGTIPEDYDIQWWYPHQESIDHGIPDTRYAILEGTAPNRIGENGRISQIYGVADTNQLDREYMDGGAPPREMPPVE